MGRIRFHAAARRGGVLPVLATMVLGVGCGGGSGSSLPTTLDLTAQADAFVCSDDWANNNYGTDQFSPRAVGQQNNVTGNQIGRQLYQFAASSAWSGVTVVSATLRLKLFDNYAGFPMDVQVLGTQDAWTETGVTWNSQPPLETVAFGTQTVTCCGGVYEFDVTTYVNAQLAGGDVTLSFVLRSADETTIGGLRWWQREGDGVTINTVTGEAPRLILQR